jgi:hypothetical protein
MDAPAWKQTAKDVPAAVLGYAIGYGVARTGLELFGEKVMREGVKPGWAQHAPKILGGLGVLATLATARQRGILKDRRDEARRKAFMEKLKAVQAKTPVAPKEGA